MIKLSEIYLLAIQAYHHTLLPSPSSRGHGDTGSQKKTNAHTACVCGILFSQLDTHPYIHRIHLIFKWTDLVCLWRLFCFHPMAISESCYYYLPQKMRSTTNEGRNFMHYKRTDGSSFRSSLARAHTHTGTHTQDTHPGPGCPCRCPGRVAAANSYSCSTSSSSSGHTSRDDTSCSRRAVRGKTFFFQVSCRMNRLPSITLRTNHSLRHHHHHQLPCTLAQTHAQAPSCATFSSVSFLFFVLLFRSHST